MIRRATVADVPDLAAVNVQTWRVAYRGLFPDAYLDGLSVAECIERWKQVLADGLRDVAVAVVAGRVVGFASVAPSRDDDAGTATGELVALYVDPSVWRRGLGRQLMEWAKDVARARGRSRMTLWVLRDNERARGFYEAAGFRADRAAKERSFGGTEVTEVRYELALRPTPPPST